MHLKRYEGFFFRNIVFQKQYYRNTAVSNKFTILLLCGHVGSVFFFFLTACGEGAG